jgi:hypothetical protein
MVKCLYINYILNNFVLIIFVHIIFYVSMTKNVIDDHPQPEDQVNRPATIPMVPTRGPGK